MDALKQDPPKKRPPKASDHLDRRALRRAAASILGALLIAACSSNSKPKALPPQTMAPRPPEIKEPVSTSPQELDPGQVSLSAGTDSSAVETPSQPPPEPPPEVDPTTMVIESPSGEGEAKSEASLFEAAEAERARREEIGDSTIVLNDKTLKRYSKGSITYMETETPEVPPTESEAGDLEPAAGSLTEVGESTDASQPPDEAEEVWRKEQYWRALVLDIRVAWRDSIDRIAELETDIATLRRDFYAEDDPFYRDSQIKPAWDRALDELAASKRAAERHEAELEEAIGEGHRRGALPGWLREGIELEPTEEELAEVPQEEGEFVEPTEPVIVDEDGGGRRR